MARTWRGTTDANWGTATNWLEGSIPTAADDVVFDASSPACTVNVVGACLSLNFTAYADTITMTNGINVGDLTTSVVFVRLGASMTIAGSGGLTIRKTSNFTMTSNGKAWPNAFNLFTVAAASAIGVATLTDNLEVGSLSINNGVNQITLSGAFTVTVNGSFTNNFTTTAGNTVNWTNLILKGAGSWINVTGANPWFSPVTLDCGANTFTFTNNTTIGSSFTYISGTVVCTGTFYIRTNGGQIYDFKGSTSSSATTTSATGVNFNNLIVFCTATGGTTSTLTTEMCVVNDFTYGSTVHTNATLGRVSLNGASIHCNKSITNRGRLLYGTSTLVLQGTGTWSDFTLQSTFNSGFGINIEINTSGTITVSGQVIKVGGSLKYTAGTVVTTGSTLIFEDSGGTIDTAGVSWNNINFFNTGQTGSTLTYTLVGNNTCAALTISATSGVLSLNGGSLTVNGSMSSPSVTSSQILGTGSIIFTGAGSWTRNVAWTGFYGVNLVFNTGGNTFTMTANLPFRPQTAGNSITYTSGNIDLTACNLVVVQGTGILTMATAGLTWPNVSVQMNAGNTSMTALNSFDVSGTFTLSTTNATYTMGGVGPYNLNNLIVNLPTSATDTLFLSHLATFTIFDSLTIKGTAAATRGLVSTSAVTRAVFTLKYGATQDVYFTNPLRIDSGAEQTVLVRKGVITDTINWELLENPNTLTHITII